MLRPYQEKAVASLRRSYAHGKKAPLFVLPTGGGKTFVFCFIAQQITARTKTACVLVHRQELLTQASRSLRAMGVQHGLIAPGYKETRDAIQVASVQTLIRRLKRSPRTFDLLIIDEAHHAVAGTWAKIVEAIPEAKILGVTATPCRADGKGLESAFDDMVQGPTVRELIAMGFLVKPVVFAPPRRFDLSSVHMRGGDYDSRELTDLLDKPTITGDAVAHYARLCPFKPAVAFCASVAHAQHVAEQFRAAGFTSQALDGSASDAERRAMINGLASGEIHVLTSCDIISEGTDIPAIEAAILLRPTKSTGLYLQQVGRALRPSEGKSRALILDHVGNCFVHGMPDDDREWSLEGVKKRKRKKQDAADIKLRQCPQCYAFHEHAAQCPECGHVYDTASREYEQVAGELKELTAEEIEAIKKQSRRQQGQAKSYDELFQLAKQRGYKNPAWWAKKILHSRGINA